MMLRLLIFIPLQLAAILLFLLSLICVLGAFDYHQIFMKEALIDSGLLFLSSVSLFIIASRFKL